MKNLLLMPLIWTSMYPKVYSVVYFCISSHSVLKYTCLYICVYLVVPMYTYVYLCIFSGSDYNLDTHVYLCILQVYNALYTCVYLAIHTVCVMQESVD